MNSKFGWPGWDRTNDQPIRNPRPELLAVNELS